MSISYETASHWSFWCFYSWSVAKLWYLLLGAVQLAWLGMRSVGRWPLRLTASIATVVLAWLGSATLGWWFWNAKIPIGRVGEWLSLLIVLSPGIMFLLGVTVIASTVHKAR